MNWRPARMLLTLALTVVGVLSLAAVAQAAAGTVKVYTSGDIKHIEYKGTNEANRVTFGGSFAAHSVTITEAGIAEPDTTADPNNICTLTGTDTLTCTDPKLGVTDWVAGSARMAAGNDVTTGEGDQNWEIFGDEGEDSLTGSDTGTDFLYGDDHNDTLEGRGDSGRLYAQDQLDGGLGNDVLRGGAGDDYVTGGAGNDDIDGGSERDGLAGDEGIDTLRGGAGGDWLASGEGEGELSEGGEGTDSFDCLGDANEIYDGGGGFDLLECFGGVQNGPNFEPNDYLVDLAGGIVRRTNHVQTVSTLKSIEDAETDNGDDVLIGTDGLNTLYAGRGNDTIDGRGGPDFVWGEFGDDTIEAADGAPDRADAGAGTDSCHADVFDEQVDCEGLTLAPAPSGNAVDRTAPSCRIASARANRAKGRIALRVTCDESASLGVQAVGRLRRLTRGALASRVGDVTLGTAAARAGAGSTVRMTVRVSRRYRRALPRRGRIRLALSAMDAVGNHSALTRTVRMR